MLTLELDEIKKIIPHREPFIFLNKIEIIEDGIKGRGYAYFSDNELFFKGHFPNNPIVPGVIIIEALAQAAGVIAGHKISDNNKSVLFMSINSAKFRKPVLPNENLVLEVSKVNQVKNVYKFSGIATRSKDVIAESVFTAMVY
tara:strand:- start:109 stop:537 length:429 start_codon:yes stop_codon:yes gene_type:complete